MQTNQVPVPGKGAPDAILEWLKIGSHGLTSLLLYDMPENAQLLPDVLRVKTRLSSLSLINASFKEGDLTLAQVLQAAPALKTLSLSDAMFHPSGSADCLQALRDSQLCEIEFSVCRLIGSPGEGDRLARMRQTHQTHHQLLQGLSEAPHLEVFKVSGLDAYSDLGFGPMLAGAFLRNPAATTLWIPDPIERNLPGNFRAGRSDQARRNFVELVSLANAQRARDRLNPVELKMAPASSDDDSELMAGLQQQFETVAQFHLDGDEMEMDEAEDFEMPDIQIWQGPPEDDEPEDDDMGDESDD